MAVETLGSDELVGAPSYADLLQRIEALEAASHGAVKQTNKLTIIAWGGDLDRIWPTTILATTAAASNFAGAGPAMFKKLAGDRQVARPEELIVTAQELGVRLIPCQMTMDLLGLKRADLLDGLEEPIGAATAIAEMRNAAVSLFI